MGVVKTLRQLTRRVDHVLLVLLGEKRGVQKKLIVPNQITATELRRMFISDYVKSQPSLLQVSLLRLYVGTRRLVGNLARWMLRKPRRTG